MVIIVDIAIMADTLNFVTLEMDVTFMIFFGTVVVYVCDIDYKRYEREPYDFLKVFHRHMRNQFPYASTSYSDIILASVDG
jgi:hypothetical protein